MRSLTRQRLLATVAALVLLVGLSAPASAAPAGAPLARAAPAITADAHTKLRADLADLVAGATQLDARIPTLVAGYRTHEIPYFAVLSQPNDRAHRSRIEALGARVLRQYRSVDAFALASDATTVLRVAALPEVAWLAPIELVTALDEPDDPISDQTRSTAGDLEADKEWLDGITGKGVRIAVLDTGLDRSHPDLDDLDFRHWSDVLNQPKLVDARDFNGGGCNPMLGDGHGHGTHVAGVATGTGEGLPTADDDARYTGIAPDAELAVGKVLTDGGAGINSDLIAAMEWAAMPADPSPTGCSIGADIVNMSLGSEARPDRLNSDSDVDLVGIVLDRLAARYGTLFTVAAGNSGPFVGSTLEAPGSAAQALSVAATSKDYDLNHDDTASGDTCAGYQHPPSTTGADNDCSGGLGTQGSSLSSFSSRGPSGDVWLRPDLAAPGYNIVSTQAATGVAIAQNDLNQGTRGRALYATATGTSMASPAAAGAAALVLQAYRDAYGTDPVGGSGATGVTAPAHALLRAAMMNSAGGDLLEGRWILTPGAGEPIACPLDIDELTFGICSIGTIFTDFVTGSLTLYEVRNRADDPYVGPLAEGAGKLDIAAAIAALRDGVVVYSAASESGTGHRDLQGSWQVGPVLAGSHQVQRFVLHAAPGAPAQSLSFRFEPGHPSDGSHPISADWNVTLPSATRVASGGEAVTSFALDVPADAPPGSYTGIVVASTSAGQVIRIPVFASVALHDSDPGEGAAAGQAWVASQMDVFAKDDTTWPSAVGTAGTGSNADWLVYPVELGRNLVRTDFSVFDAAAGDETYDLYLYDANLDLEASTHPFAAPGVTDRTANASRTASTRAAPQVLSVARPSVGRHYLAVSRARIGGTTPGDFGAFVLGLDEVGGALPAAATQLTYEGDYLFRQGDPGRLSAVLTDASGAPIPGRTVTFTVDGSPGPCASGCSAVTDLAGRAQLATDPIALSAGIHEVRATFAGDAAWQPSEADAFVVVLAATDPPPLPAGSARVSAGGWIPGASGHGKDRVHFAFHAASGVPGPSGQLRWRDETAGVDLTLVRYRTLTTGGDHEVTLTGQARLGDGRIVSFSLTAQDAGEPDKGADNVRLRILETGYDRSGQLGGGNIELHTD